MRNWVIFTALFVVRHQKSFIDLKKPLTLLVLEKEIEIVYDLAQRVLRFEDALVESSDVCGQIDRYVLHSFREKQGINLSSITAMAQAASFYKLVRPKMVSENIVKIKGGR